jgi:predicted amidohydrolase
MLQRLLYLAYESVHNKQVLKYFCIDKVKIYLTICYDLPIK